MRQDAATLQPARRRVLIETSRRPVRQQIQHPGSSPAHVRLSGQNRDVPRQGAVGKHVVGVEDLNQFTVSTGEAEISRRAFPGPPPAANADTLVGRQDVRNDVRRGAVSLNHPLPCPPGWHGLQQERVVSRKQVLTIRPV